MKNMILYVTGHGCTEKYADFIAGYLDGDSEVKNLRKQKDVDLEAADTVIIGGSIHAGGIQKAVKKFCAKNMKTLLKKRLGLFICCMEEGESAKKQFDNAFPQELRDHAQAEGCFGGEFDFDKMNAAERFIVKKVAKVDNSVSKYSEEAAKKFAEKLQ